MAQRLPSGCPARAEDVASVASPLASRLVCGLDREGADAALGGPRPRKRGSLDREVLSAESSRRLPTREGLTKPVREYLSTYLISSLEGTYCSFWFEKDAPARRLHVPIEEGEAAAAVVAPALRLSAECLAGH